MRKSKHQLDLNIKREVTLDISNGVLNLCDMAISEFASASAEVAEPNTFAFQYLKDVLLSKYVDENTDTPEDRRNRAIEKWLGVELRNLKTNSRLFSTDPHFDGIGTGWEVLRLAARLVKRVIGASPPSDILLRGSFTGGATTSRKRGVATLASKFQGSLDATPHCRSRFIEEMEREYPEMWTFYQPELNSPRLVKGNVLFTVPKSTVIDRVACKEPDLNIFCQKAVGDYFRRQLKKRARIDLNDQSINRGLAREGSRSGQLATIDLSSASDSLTTGLVSALLPLDWFRLLDDLRSPKTFIDGFSHSNAMFSSMGNGFTFELESMVFWALAQATCTLSRHRGRVSVYGDDIILPSSIAKGFLNVLRWTGFTPNVSKTFVAGPFRESCGGHYYRGLDVTPFYIRRPLKDVSDLVLFLNQFRAWVIRVEADASLGGYDSPNAFVRWWNTLASLVPKPLWGGYSTESRTQLASPGKQQCELLMTTRRLTREEVKHQTGLYLSRLSELDRRGSTPLSESSFSQFRVDTGIWTMRRVKFRPGDFGLFCPLFLPEQG